MPFDQDIRERAAEVLELCRVSRLTVTTVESCTGGLVSAALTEIAGSSDVVERGFVTYTNAAKTALVDVPTTLLDTVGAVSEEVARAMAAGGIARSDADIAVAVTGVAGPGASEKKPAGLVHLAVACRNGAVIHECCRFPGDRSAVREASVLKALDLIEALIRRS